MLAKRGCVHVKFNHSTSLPSIPLNPTYSSSKSIIYCNSKISENGIGNINEADLYSVACRSRWTAMLTAYAENGRIHKARKVFEEMPQRNVASWNAMILVYMRNKNGIDNACELLSKSPEKKAVSYAIVITGFVRAGRLDDAEKLYSSMPMKWRDPFCSNALMNGYLKNGKLEEAVRIYNGMLEKTKLGFLELNG